METLSGGNLQRVVVWREVARQPDCTLSAGAAWMSPTLKRCANCCCADREGAGVLLFSEDMEELFNLSDRLLVLYHGQLVGHLRRHEFDAHRVGHLMTGGQ